jgi:gas vesicle protein GvpA/GvpJ/GvpM family
MRRTVTKRKRPERVVDLKTARGPTTVDLIDRILDKGIVIEYQVDRISLSGIDLPVTVDARFVVASLDTYLEYAEPLRKNGVLGSSDALLDELTNA